MNLFRKSPKMVITALVISSIFAVASLFVLDLEAVKSGEFWTSDVQN